MNPIRPLQRVHSPEELSKAAAGEAEPAAESGKPLFPALFKEAAEDVRQTEAGVGEEIAKLATGREQSPHDFMIASQKASLSVSLMVELRNRALDAYKEIMNTSV